MGPFNGVDTIFALLFFCVTVGLAVLGLLFLISVSMFPLRSFCFLPCCCCLALWPLDRQPPWWRLCCMAALLGRPDTESPQRPLGRYIHVTHWRLLLVLEGGSFGAARVFWWIGPLTPGPAATPCSSGCVCQISGGAAFG